ERGAETGRVVGDLWRQMQLIATLFRQRQANQSARVARHEIDYFRCDFFRSANQITFVFAIFVIDDDDHSSLTNVSGGVRNGSECHLEILDLGFAIFDRRYGSAQTPGLAIHLRGEPVLACSARIRSTYFAITSTSRFTSSPGLSCEKLVTSQVLGMMAISK